MDRPVPLSVTVAIDGWLRVHYLLPAVLWAATSLGPLAGWVPSRAWILTLSGVSLLVCGIGDHLLITRTLAPATGGSHDFEA